MAKKKANQKTTKKENVDTKEVSQKLAVESIPVMEVISGDAKREIESFRSQDFTSFASINTFNDQALVRSENIRSRARRDNLEVVFRSPLVARVIVQQEGKVAKYYFSKGSPVTSRGENGDRYISRYQRAGQLASLDIGDKFVLGSNEVKVLEVATFKPFRDDEGWDSRDTYLKGEGYRPVTISSLRLLLDRYAGDDLVEQILEEERQLAAVSVGAKRSILRKMELREQAILDKYQDAIPRLPIRSKIIVLGPPGTGKTTTLIRRLAAKISHPDLTPEEKAQVEAAELFSSRDHRQSWIMFAPTELLKLYVKEAFNQDGVPAPSERIQTWDYYRNELARNRFGILRSASGGQLTSTDDSALLSNAVGNSSSWFDDFQVHQWQRFFFELQAAAQVIANQPLPLGREGRRIAGVLSGRESRYTASAIAAAIDASKGLRDIYQSYKADADTIIRDVLNGIIKKRRLFLKELAAFLDGMESATDEGDEEELEIVEEAEVVERTSIQAAVQSFNTALRLAAQAKASGRKLGLNSRASKIIEWLGSDIFDDRAVVQLASKLEVQRALHRLTNPLSAYFSGLVRRYRVFRRERLDEGKWYSKESKSNEVGGLEIDVILLAFLKAGRDLLSIKTVSNEIASPGYASLKPFAQNFQNMVLIDEVTDFSPVQISCMFNMTNPETDSVTACGDINQRITGWGASSIAQLQWAVPRAEISEIEISYRLSPKLFELAKDLAAPGSSIKLHSAVAEYSNSDDVSPVLGAGLQGDKLALWLSDRIGEIEKRVGFLPSTAVLVANEDFVEPVANELTNVLRNFNLRAVACRYGQTMGEDNDVRVFDVKHIKGLEFEAVFLVHVDKLAEQQPEVFDRYLFVGATRAATFFGITCAGDRMPHAVDRLKTKFTEHWKV